MGLFVSLLRGFGIGALIMVALFAVLILIGNWLFV